MTIRHDAPPSSARHYLGLAGSVGGTMLDVALLVVGSVLIGLAVAVILDGFDLVDVGLDLSTGGMLGSGLVVAIVGGFALGLASEGPLGRGRVAIGHREVEIAVGRAIASVVVGLGLLVLHGILEGVVADLPRPFTLGVESLRAAALSGLFVVPLLGVPLSWLVRSGGLGSSFVVDADVPVLYFVWAIATMLFL